MTLRFVRTRSLWPARVVQRSILNPRARGKAAMNRAVALQRLGTRASSGSGGWRMTSRGSTLLDSDGEDDVEVPRRHVLHSALA
ncbi:uncharacterized protein B0H18DRAFT_1024780 [Fomitopsis serialis]|uniref:uncharacterized protein n=1 Tax=Fomitopsis serialis TaxID=139415 RepID=UPI00200862F2|nr:uncharacterized protein B0H18DRAFT_1024780 [Neoantrodia serialis]KAH9920312.1 hypothetical protein B0H18DRAFT_1024780 [Neoantrodia serialis]